MDVRRIANKPNSPRHSEMTSESMTSMVQQSVFAFALVDGRIRRKCWCPIEQCYRMVPQPATNSAARST